MADDTDGPSNSHIRYSIIDGNQGSPFTIDPTRGEVKVTKLLDRETVRAKVWFKLFTNHQIGTYKFLCSHLSHDGKYGKGRISLVQALTSKVQTLEKQFQ